MTENSRHQATLDCCLQLTNQLVVVLRRLSMSVRKHLSADILEDDGSRLEVHQQHGLQLGLGSQQLLI